MYFYHNNEIVKFTSDKKQDTELDYIKNKPTKAEDEKIKANWTLTIDGKKIKFTKPAHIKKQEKQESIEDIKTKLKDIEDIKAREAIENLMEIISS